jgi:hypothetical protein
MARQPREGSGIIGPTYNTELVPPAATPRCYLTARGREPPTRKEAQELERPPVSRGHDYICS